MPLYSFRTCQWEYHLLTLDGYFERYSKLKAFLFQRSRLEQFTVVRIPFNKVPYAFLNANLAESAF